MKMNKILLVLALSCSAVSTAYADGEEGSTPEVPATPGAGLADQGHGKINFTGSIIDAPCSIKPVGDKDGVQTVDLGSISNASLENGGTSAPQQFTISLENCSIKTAKTVKTTFDGAKSASGNLGMTGTAKGASIVLTDGNSNIIELGKPTAGQQLSAGAQSADLVFSAYLKGDMGKDAEGKDTDKGVDIVPGSFNSTANFTLSYN
ncbi:fimbrial protein [Rouxiella sp. Mn2063]|uniref:fimbrial protein n=1 Tax=Rouxiella sp. Mn2063 TaxID=3395262 RepID=UPI003BD6E9DD